MQQYGFHKIQFLRYKGCNKMTKQILHLPVQQFHKQTLLHKMLLFHESFKDDQTRSCLVTQTYYNYRYVT